MRLAINGFGRIGKTFLRVLCSDKQASEKLDIAVINVGPSSIENVAHFFKYDTLMGVYQGTVVLSDNFLCIDNKKIEIISQPTPSQNVWGKKGIDWVVDCSGRFTERDKAEIHIDQGATKVLISAPASDEDIAIIPGVNDNLFDAKKHTIISLGSCTTNALFPVLKVLFDAGYFQHGIATTIHAYTPSQALLDTNNNDVERSRAAALNIVPTKTGAASMVAKIMPTLKNKIDIVAVRVPVAKVSLLELVFQACQNIEIALLHDTFKEAANNAMKNIICVSQEALVSSDFYGRPESVIIDTSMTRTCQTLGTIFGWYDNEWGYSQRIKDFLLSTI